MNKQASGIYNEVITIRYIHVSKMSGEHRGVDMARWQQWLALFVFTLLLPVFLAACELQPQKDQNLSSSPASEALTEEVTHPSVADEPQSPDVETTDSYPTDVSDAVINAEDQAASDATAIATITISPVGCEYLYFFEPAPELCPRGEPIISFAAEQLFENGFMVWIENSGSIYVFYNDQTWEQFEDTFEGGQPDPVPDIVPPVERYMPIRGFGLIWHDHPHVQEKLGWALNPESGFELILQEQMVETGEDNISYLSTSSGQVIALMRHNQDNGDWIFTASTTE